MTNNTNMRRSSRHKDNQEAKKDKKFKFNFNWKEWKLRNKIFSILFLILLILAIVFYFIPMHKAKKPLSFMFLGIDTDNYRQETYNDKKPHRTDAIMVATFNPSTYDVEITSIPRDTSVDYQCTIEDRKVRGPINEIYEVSGREVGCLRDSVSKFLNVPIDYYAIIDMSKLAKIVDDIGGIELQVHAQDGSFCQVTTDVSKKYCFKNGDVEQMMGEEAVAYSRFRKDSEKDYGRGRRQQQVISAILSKIASEKKFDIQTITKIMSSITTDIPPMVVAKYFSYFKHMSEVGKMVSGEINPSKKVLPNKAWKRIFELIEFNTSNVSNETVTEAIEKIKTMPKYAASPLQLFFTNHQFVNKTSNGFYVTPDDQRYEISNALRKNLGLSEETPPPFENPFGRYELLTDNEAYLEGIGEDIINNLPDANQQEKQQAPSEPSSNVKPKAQEEINNKPTITGDKNYTIELGQNFTPNLSGNDVEDGRVDVVLISGNLDVNKPGKYTLVYQAKDSKGLVSDPYTITVTVKEQKLDLNKVKTDANGNKYYDNNGVCYKIIQNVDGSMKLGEKLNECPTN